MCHSWTDNCYCFLILHKTCIILGNHLFKLYKLLSGLKPSLSSSSVIYTRLYKRHDVLDLIRHLSSWRRPLWSWVTVYLPLSQLTQHQVLNSRNLMDSPEANKDLLRNPPRLRNVYFTGEFFFGPQNTDMEINFVLPQCVPLNTHIELPLMLTGACGFIKEKCTFKLATRIRKNSEE